MLDNYRAVNGNLVGTKRHTETENHVNYKEFPIPSIRAEFGVKYVDPAERLKGREAFFQVDHPQSFIPRAHSNKVQLNVKLTVSPPISTGCPRPRRTTTWSTKTDTAPMRGP